ncbi:MAG: hypothetical protein WDA00_04505 [Eubacteriales bacterium]
MSLQSHDTQADSACVTYLISDIRLPVDYTVSRVFETAAGQLRWYGVTPAEPRFRIFKKSVDARNKQQIMLVWTVAVTAAFSEKEQARLSESGIQRYAEPALEVRYGTETLRHRPLVVGTGPAGLFCALLLAECGYRPVLLERGGPIEERDAAVARFMTEGVLDPSCNIQYGAGGAGTYSDGKLLTRITDSLIGHIIETFVRFGAPEEIRWQAKPHIGTDILKGVVARMLAHISALGGEICYHTQLTELTLTGSDNIAHTNQADLPFDALVLAFGHSARDTYRMLFRKGLAVEPKPFSVGLRVEHLQADIDTALYGKFAGHPQLGPAAYALSCNTDNRGVYTFCMCPGGEVVAAASEPYGVVTNGMSRFARDGRNANAAVAVSVRCEDYGSTPEAAIAFQRQIERAAYTAAGGDYSVPLLTVGDFFKGACRKEPGRVLPTYRGGNAFRLVRPEAYLPAFVCESLRNGLLQFDRKIKGFAAPDALLSGPETRTSAPVRVLRDKNHCALGFPQLYPCGEGAGYAGGITSAAADGLRTALQLMRRYRPL